MKNEHPKNRDELRAAINRRLHLAGGFRVTCYTPQSGRARDYISIHETDGQPYTLVGDSEDPEQLVGKPFWAHVFSVFDSHTHCIVG